MAKDGSESEVREKRERKEKKDKKRKHDEVENDAEVEIVAEKKSKKDKKRKSTDADGDVVVADAPAATEVALVKSEDEDTDKKAVVKVEVPLVALVPFANPLCEEKSQKKVLKSVKKGMPPPPTSSNTSNRTVSLMIAIAAAKNKALKRGVKECVKAIRKSPPATPATPATLAASASPNGIVVLAADISPMDVISHIPVLCEDHGIPYVYVHSRAELGSAGATKRPTSVVMITPRVGKGGEGGEEWDAVYGELHRLAVKLGQSVRV